MKRFWLLLLIFTVSACASKNPNFYQPVALNESQQVYADFKQNILVDNILLPAVQTKPQIATLGDENYELKIDEFNRWGANPDKLIQQVINDDLSLIFPNAIIENKTTLRKNYKYAVWIEIQKMSGRLDENALLQASYFIKNKRGRILKQGQFKQDMAIDGDYDAYIPAQSKLLSLLAKAIADDLIALK